jgi:hypothetical protein
MESSSAAAPAAQELWPEQPVAAAERRVRHLGAGDEQHGRWSRPFSFLQMADTQLGFVETCYENRLPIRVAPDLAPEAQLPAEGFEVELALLNKAVDEINRLRPAFAVVCGDMINAYPAAMGKQDGDKRAAQLGAFKAACGRVHPSVPLVCVCGNHDVGDRPNAASIAQYRGEFGDDYFTFWVKGVKCICVNSQFWKDASDAAELRAAHDAWLRQELQAPDTATAKYCLVFAHYPPFLMAQDEPAEYFNLDPAVRDEVMGLFARHRVRAVFCGHYHRNAGGWWHPPEEEGAGAAVGGEGAGTGAGAGAAPVEVVVTGAAGGNISTKPGADPLGIAGMDGCAVGEAVSGMRVVRVGEEELTHEWRTYEELSCMECLG